jgi:hypothetical protein
VTDLRRALLLSLFVAAGCDSGPTSDWPNDPSTNNPDKDRDDDHRDDDTDGPPTMAADAGVGGIIDASAPRIDSGISEECATPDAGDAGCQLADF